MSKREQLNHSRPLGLLEKYQVSKQLVNVYGTLLLSAHIKLDNPLPFNDGNAAVESYLRNRLLPTIQQICNEQPLLSLTIADIDTNTPRFNIIDSLEYDTMVKVDHQVDYLNDNLLANSLKEELSNDFDLTSKTTPLWRLRILVHSDREDQLFMILTVHHVISDGVSTTIIFTRLLELLNQQKEEEEENNTTTTITIDSDKIPKLEEPFDKRTPHHPTIGDLIPIIIKHKLLPSFIAKYFEVSYWGGQTPSIAEKHNTMVRIFEIPTDKFSQLLAKCKQEKTTPHAAIYISSIMANITALGEETMSIRTNTPINAKPYCVPESPATEVGNFVASFDRTKSYSLPALKDRVGFWQACREYKSELTASNIYSVKSTNMLHYVGDFPSKWIEFWDSKRTSTPMGRSCTFEVSDVGRWQPTIQDNQQRLQENTLKWKVLSSTYAQSCNVVGTVFHINLVSTNGMCKATCTWHKGAIEETTIDSIINNILIYLDTMMKTVDN